MINFFKLIRYQNLLIIIITQYFMRWFIIKPILEVNFFQLQLSEFNFFLLVLSTVFISAAGYVINDYFDTKTDLINRPDTVIVGRFINRRIAMLIHTLFSISGICIGFYLSFFIKIPLFSFIFVIVSGLLWFYSTTYKRQFLIGNIIVAVLTALVPFIVIIFELPLLNKTYGPLLLQADTNFNYILVWISGFSFFAFITTLIREIIKDIEDFEGDNAFGRNSMPIIIGILYTKIVVVFLCSVLIISLLYVFVKYLNDNITLLYFLIAIIIPVSFLIFRIVTSREKRDYHTASIMSKFIMIAGVIYAPVANFIISTGY